MRENTSKIGSRRVSSDTASDCEKQKAQKWALTAARQALERLQLLVQRRSSLRDQFTPGHLFAVPLAIIQVRHDGAGMFDDGDDS